MRIDGVKEVKADPKTERVRITFDARKTHAPALHDAILRSGYKPAPMAD
jgi:copper chaperone CopZ